jgi:hypothetical protein
MNFSGLFRSEDKKKILNEQYMYIVLVLILQSKKKSSQILLKRAKISVIPMVLNGVLIILFALILKVITSICNETIFHLIVKLTVAKLCGVGIVYSKVCPLGPLPSSHCIITSNIVV